MAKLGLSKIDVAERQLDEAIKLLFEGRDPVSIHTLVAAAERVISDLAAKQNIVSPLRDADLYIKPEYHKKWFDKVNESANFFKHADRDTNEIHEFNTELNEYYILFSLFNLEALKRPYSWERKIFTGWFGLKNPGLLKKEGEFQKIFKMLPDVHGISHTDMKHFYFLILIAKNQGKLSMADLLVLQDAVKIDAV